MPRYRHDNLLIRERRAMIVDTALRIGTAAADKVLGVSRSTSWQTIRDYGNDFPLVPKAYIDYDSVHTVRSLPNDLENKRREVKALQALYNYYKQRNKL